MEEQKMPLTPPPCPTTKPAGSGGARYRECLKNHAVGIGGQAVDGCGEFLPAGKEGTLAALKCAACNCHRNFHRKEHHIDTSTTPTPRPQHHQVYQFYPYNHRSIIPAAAPSPTGYLHVSAPQQQGRENNKMEEAEEEDCGGGGMTSSSGKKRYRTKFTAEQKEKMVELAEGLGWRIQKQDEAAVQQFCNDTGVKRQVLKVWMHNNKHTLGGNKP